MYNFIISAWILLWSVILYVDCIRTNFGIPVEIQSLQVRLVSFYLPALLIGLAAMLISYIVKYKKDTQKIINDVLQELKKGEENETH